MCKAPKPPKPKEPKKPMFLKNRYLDSFVGDSAAVTQLRTGRSQLRIPLGGPAPIQGRTPPTTTPPNPGPQPVGPRGNPNRPPRGGDFRRLTP